MTKMTRYIAGFILLLMLGTGVQALAHGLEALDHDHACNLCQVLQEDLESSTGLGATSFSFDLPVCRVPLPTVSYVLPELKTFQPARAPPAYA